MKLTKFGHSCMLVEMTEPVSRTALFDPGVYSTVDVAALERLDDIFITHGHPDHMDVALLQQLRGRFPEVRITTPKDAQAALEQAGIGSVGTEPPEGVRFFQSPHEAIKPLGHDDPPEENGIHYLDVLTDPGDCHSFHETMPVLVLPINAPWGSLVGAVKVVLEARPKYVIPAHDWPLSDEARMQTYERLEKRLAEEGIVFLKMKNGEPVVLNDVQPQLQPLSAVS